MNPGASSLNPYAASYIPVARREINDKLTGEDIEHGIAHNCHHNNEPGRIAPLHNSNPSLDSVTHGTGKRSIPKTSAPKTHPSHVSLVQSPGELTEEQIMDENVEADLDFLCMTFPGLSNDSLTSVYWANGGDLEATIDMLHLLEMPIVGSSETLPLTKKKETLPDTLDIGDVSEPVSPPTCGARKLKNVAGESSTAASSSGSAESAAAS